MRVRASRHTAGIADQAGGRQRRAPQRTTVGRSLRRGWRRVRADQVWCTAARQDGVDVDVVAYLGPAEQSAALVRNCVVRIEHWADRKLNGGVLTPVQAHLHLGAVAA